MADYHFHVTQIKRSKGQSAVACAAYRSGEKLFSEYYGKVSDYTRKRGIVHSEILLPSHAPPEYSNRQTLWNAVEKAEPHPKAQLAYSFDIALQNEFSMEENIALTRHFLLEEFVSRGMICDFAVHLPDKKDGIQNPHFHVLCPMRPLDENGHWGAKQLREYVLDEHGERLRNKSGEYVFNAIPTTDWGSPETLEHWRKAWCDLCNSKFEEKSLDERIDHRSYERQGVELLPTVHEGPTVRAMEKRGIQTEKGSLNKWIKATNKMILVAKKKVSALEKWVSENRQSELIQSLNAYNSMRNAGAYSQTAKVNNLKELTDDINFLKVNGIETFEDLQDKITELGAQIDGFKAQSKEKEARLKELDSLLVLAQHYVENKPVADELAKIKWKAKREKFKAENENSLRLYHMAERKLKPYFTNGKLPINAWRNEKAQLQKDFEEIQNQFSAVRGDVKRLWQIKYKIEQANNQSRENRKEKRRETYEI